MKECKFSLSLFLLFISNLLSCNALGNNLGSSRIEILHRVSKSSIENQFSLGLIRTIKYDLSMSEAFTLSSGNQNLNKLVSIKALIDNLSGNINNVRFLLIISVKKVKGLRAIAYFRLYDTLKSSYIAERSLEFKTDGWRRAGHIISDTVYSTVTGLEGYFDTKIVYLRDNELGVNSKRITVADYDNANTINITEEGFDSFDPDFSKDVQRVIYVAANKDNTKSYIVIHDLKKQDKIRLNICTGMCSHPHFSEEGDKILYLDSYDNIKEIKYYDFTDNQSYTLIKDNFTNDSPSYSPDGSNVIFSSNKNGTNNIYSLNLANNEVSDITDSSEFEHIDPSLSPKGDWIAYIKYDNQTKYLALVSANGDKEEILLKGRYSEPYWLPNGRGVVISEDIDFGNKIVKRSSIVMINSKSPKRLPFPDDVSSLKWSNNLNYLFMNKDNTSNEKEELEQETFGNDD